MSTCGRPLQKRWLHINTSIRRCHAAQGLSLDVVLPLGVGALLPNLRALSLLVCLLTPAAAASTLDAGCTLLHSLTVEHLVVLPAAGAGAGAPAATQANSSLQQLANLPSLSAVALLDGSCPTLFLAELGTQLTGLHLNGSYRQCLPGTQTPTPAWRATLQHVARCTRLRDLVIPGATAEELHLVAPALQHLRTLCLTQPEPMSGDGDAVIEALLGLPHLTSLDWHVGARLTFSRWRTESPCGWEELMLGCATPEQLARLPLHSLKQPVRWQILVVRRNTPVHEVRAAVANVVERCPEGFRWNGTSEAMPPQLVLWRGKVAPVLRALQPLFAALAAVEVAGVKWDARLVEVLGEVLPRTCTRLALSDGRANEAALEQVARSLPWVQRLELLEELAAPDDVVGFVRLARRLKEQEGGGVVRLEEVVVERPVRPSGMDKEQRMAAWDQAAREVTLPGREGCGGVVLRVVWEEQKQEPFGGL